MHNGGGSGSSSSSSHGEGGNVFKQLKVLVGCLSTEFGTIMGVDMLVEALWSIIRLSSALADNHVLQCHEAAVVRLLQAQGWQSSNSKTPARVKLGRMGAGGRPQGQVPVANRLTARQGSSSAVAAGLSPLIAASLLDAYDACEYEMQHANLKRVCRQLAMEVG
eukprot:GHRR01017825.1.p2 GENE.GHRR01017825.1~~GHRR01017825.1.p2  ORF type:complete len:177 (+),score=67.91 GHRR01017825.1:40-531(+)